MSWPETPLTIEEMAKYKAALDEQIRMGSDCRRRQEESQPSPLATQEQNETLRRKA